MQYMCCQCGCRGKPRGVLKTLCFQAQWKLPEDTEWPNELRIISCMKLISKLVYVCLLWMQSWLHPKLSILHECWYCVHCLRHNWNCHSLWPYSGIKWRPIDCALLLLVSCRLVDFLPVWFWWIKCPSTGKMSSLIVTSQVICPWATAWTSWMVPPCIGWLKLAICFKTELQPRGACLHCAAITFHRLQSVWWPCIAVMHACNTLWFSLCRPVAKYPYPWDDTICNGVAIQVVT